MKRFSLLLLLALVPVSLVAQEQVPKVELGLSYENLQASHANSLLGGLNFGRRASGVNFRATININRWAAVETTFGFQPDLNVETVGGAPAISRGFGGAEFNVLHNEYKFKATARQGDKDQLGIFAFAGPGWVHADPNSVLEPLVGSFTKSTVEFGGGVEYYPHRKFGLRVEVSDLIARLGTITVTQPTTNNFVLRVGASFRFH